MLGALHAAGFGDAVDHNLRKRKRDEKTLTSASFSQQLNVARSMAAGTDYGDGRRAKMYQCRLHMAKYLKCDPLLKELFFPILTQASRFGFCSTTGINQVGAAFDSLPDAKPPTTNAKSAGVYRGLAMFTLRSNAMTNSDASKLNTTHQKQGVTMITGSSLDLKSAWRRFNNGPSLKWSDQTGSVVGENMKAPTVTHNQYDTSSDPPVTNSNDEIFVSEVGSINALETKAVQSSNFQNALGSTSATEGTTTQGVEGGSTTGVNWDGTGSVVNANGSYYSNLKNTTIRIADGYLELDITNGKATSTFIELVIHAHKKHSSAVSTQQLLNAIHNAVHYQQSDRNVSAYFSNSSNDQNPGGWQAFWDPTYPLLACKAQHRKPIDDIAREVHRSNHMLGPGQSKMIKVHLGSLYYDIGGKAVANSNDGEDHVGNNNSPFSFANPATGVGALNISIGHSGVQQLSAPVHPGANDIQFANYPDSFDANTLEHTASGGGFWVGKSFCPSEIVVSGNYCEKFYPSYVVDKSRRNWSDRPLLPPTAGTTLSLPTALPVMESVGIVSMQEPVPAVVSSQNNQEL